MKIMFSFLELKQQDVNENNEPPTNSALFIETRKKTTEQDLQGVL